MFLDVDECALGSHSCQQTCVNLVGGYSCGCNHGYVSNSYYTCRGKWVIVNPQETREKSNDSLKPAGNEIVLYEKHNYMILELMGFCIIRLVFV